MPDDHLTPLELIPVRMAANARAMKQLQMQQDFFKAELERHHANCEVGDKFRHGDYVLSRVQTPQAWDYSPEQKEEQKALKQKHQQDGAVPKERSWVWRLTGGPKNEDGDAL